MLTTAKGQVSLLRIVTFVLSSIILYRIFYSNGYHVFTHV